MNTIGKIINNSDRTFSIIHNLDFVIYKLWKYLQWKNIVCFRFPTNPIKTCATQIYLIFFFLEIYKLRDGLLAVVKVTKKNVTKRRGGGVKSVQKTKNRYVMYRQDMHGSEFGVK